MGTEIKRQAAVSAQIDTGIATPSKAQAPVVDQSKLDAGATELLKNIQQNRGQLVEHQATATKDQRPDIADRIAGLISKLDQAAGMMAAKPKEGVEPARQTAQEVITDFNKVADAWKPAQTAVDLKKQTAADVKKQTAPVGTKDTVETGTCVQPAALTGVESRLTALESRLTETETQNAKLRDQIEAREKAEADEAKKPGFFRALLEIFEGVGRWFNPFFNIVSAVFRVAKIGYKVLTGKKVDWTNEGIRLVGDVAGIFFPPVGAAVNAGMNLWKNESEVLGGMNEVFDKEKKENPFRRGFTGATDIIKGTYDKAKTTITGDAPEPSKRSIEYRPVAAELKT